MTKVILCYNDKVFCIERIDYDRRKNIIIDEKLQQLQRLGSLFEIKNIKNEKLVLYGNEISSKEKDNNILFL